MKLTSVTYLLLVIFSVLCLIASLTNEDRFAWVAFGLLIGALIQLVFIYYLLKNRS